jgi:hypothetical protein
MKTPRFIVAWTFAIAIFGSTVQSQDRPDRDASFLDRELYRSRGFVVGSSLITRMSFSQLFQSMQLPWGFESVEAFDGGPAPWEETDSTPTALIVTNGLTLRQLLDAIVRTDSRYQWRVVDGVVVMRPAAAWAEAGHPLHRAVPPVVLDTVTYAGAVDGILEATGQFTTPNADPTEDVRFSLQFAGGSLLELLSGVAREHGTFGWSLMSSRRPDGPERIVRAPQLNLQGHNRVTLKPEGTYVKTLGAVISKALLPGPVISDPITVRGQRPAYARPAGVYVAGTGAIIVRAQYRDRALPGVKVTITGPGEPIDAVTDGDGSAEVRGAFQAAPYTVRLQLPGFATIQRTIEARSLGLVSVNADMRICDATLEGVTVDLGPPATFRQASAVVHFKIGAIDGPRPAREAGEGVCGGREIEVRGASLAVAKLAPALEAPRAFLVQRDTTGYRVGEEFLAFLHWNPGLQQYVPFGYMVPVVDGRIVWKGSDDVLRSGLTIRQAINAVQRLGRR